MDLILRGDFRFRDCAFPPERDSRSCRRVVAAASDGFPEFAAGAFGNGRDRWFVAACENGAKATSALKITASLLTFFMDLFWMETLLGFELSPCRKHSGAIGKSASCAEI